MSNEVKSPWPGPKGLIPVTSGKAEDANVFNRQYLDGIHVEMRVLDSVEPDLSTTILGETFSSPIMMPAFSHLNKVGKDNVKPMVEYAKAAKKLGVLNWVGMEPDDEFLEILQVGAKTVRIIKPFADKQMILDQIAFAQEHGAFAVGVDIDHIAGEDGKYDVVDGIPMGPVMQKDLEMYVAASKVPFIAKGVLSVQDALKAKEAGCAGIVVSHHHGRIPFGMPPAAMLEDIKAAVGSDMVVFCDCGMDDGFDVYKALALGADAAAVGRGILAPLLKEGCDGVVNKVQKMNEQLSQLMMYTAVKDTRSFDASVLYFA